MKSWKSSSLPLCGVRHQQEVARELGEELPEPIAFGVFDFAAEECR
jgi:hypothetical protein